MRRFTLLIAFAISLSGFAAGATTHGAVTHRRQHGLVTSTTRCATHKGKSGKCAPPPHHTRETGAGKHVPR